MCFYLFSSRPVFPLFPNIQYCLFAFIISFCPFPFRRSLFSTVGASRYSHRTFSSPKNDTLSSFVGLVLHMEQQHWEEFSRFCLACEEPVEAGGEGEVACPDGGEGEVTCPDCGCRYHAACLPDTDLQSWCLYCRSPL
jgi:hypothetical protein